MVPDRSLWCRLTRGRRNLVGEAMHEVRAQEKNMIGGAWHARHLFTLGDTFVIICLACRPLRRAL